MEISVADDRVLVIVDQLDESRAEEIAWKEKKNAFGSLQKVTGFFNSPKDEDFKLVYKEHRYEPFWHVAGTAKYVYDRTVKHLWPTTGSEVKSLTLTGVDYEADGGKITASVLEHCHQEEASELVVNGLTGAKDSSLKEYLKFSSKVFEKADLEKLSKESIVVPPQTRASSLVRDTAAKMMHSIEADQIFEENVVFQHVDLYYRPVYAFKFLWISKNKEAVVEVDGLTGHVTFGKEVFQQLMGKMLDYDFLFDVGGDAAGMIVPGGSIAVKLAKKYIDARKKK